MGNTLGYNPDLDLTVVGKWLVFYADQKNIMLNCIFLPYKTCFHFCYRNNAFVILIQKHISVHSLFSRWAKKIKIPIKLLENHYEDSNFTCKTNYLTTKNELAAAYTKVILTQSQKKE
jgi:hypothetical protein